MYERFTDRAQKVMRFANQEAQRYNHEFIGTEHILLGLIKEGSGTAVLVLESLNIDLHQIKLLVEKLIQAGPEMIILGKLHRALVAGTNTGRRRYRQPSVARHWFDD